MPPQRAQARRTVSANVWAGPARQHQIRALLAEKLTLAKGSSNAMYGLRISSGFEDVPHATEFVCPLWVEGRWTHRARSALLWTVRMLSRRRAKVVDGVPLPVLVRGFDASFDALAERAGRWRVTVLKNASYLTRRYVDVPARTYRILAIPDPNGRGCAVVRPPTRRGSAGYLVDLVREAGDKHGLDTLIAAAVDDLRCSGAGYISTFATDPEARDQLKRAAFFDTGSTPHFTFRAMDAEAAELLSGLARPSGRE